MKLYSPTVFRRLGMRTGPPLELAMEHEYYDCAEILGKNNADLGPAIVSTMDEKKFEFLVDQAVMYSNKTVKSVFIAAVEKGNASCVKFILQKHRHLAES